MLKLEFKSISSIVVGYVLGELARRVLHAVFKKCWYVCKSVLRIFVVYVCVRMCVYVYLYVYVYVCMCMYVYVCVCMCVYVCGMCAYMCMCIYMSICVCMCMYVCVCVCMCGRVSE